MSPRNLFFLAILAVLSVLPNRGGATTNDDFARGLEWSRAGRFPEAAAAFGNAAKAQPAVGTFLNLGLAEWQRGHAGLAILAWEKAIWIDPFDPRARDNLAFARQAAQVEAPQLKWFEKVSTWLPPNAWAWLAGAALWLAVGLVVLPGILGFRKTGWPQWPAALAVGVFLLCLTADIGVVSRTRIGFVTRKNTPLQLTPTHNAEVVSTLAAGEPARVLRTRGNYVFIRTATGAGWVEQDGVGLVCPQ